MLFCWIQVKYLDKNFYKVKSFTIWISRWFIFISSIMLKLPMYVMMHYKSCLSACFIKLDAMFNESDILKLTTLYLWLGRLLTKNSHPIGRYIQVCFLVCLKDLCNYAIFVIKDLDLTLRNQLVHDVYTHLYFIIWLTMWDLHDTLSY